MAIDSRFLDDITPAEGAVSRLSKKKKIRPWEGNLVPTPAEPPAKEKKLSEPVQPPPSPAEVGASAALLAPEPVAEPVAKPVAPPIQTRTEPVAEAVPVSKRTDTKPLPIQSEPVAKPVAAFGRTGTEPVAEPVAVEGLVQLQRRILFYVFSRCQLVGSLTSPLVTKEEIRDTCKTTTGAAKQAILKLERKGMLKRLHSISGVSGGNIFHIPQGVFHSLSLLRTGSELVAVPVKPVAEPVAKPVAGALSSSSDLDLTNTTTTETQNSNALDVSAIDCSPLAGIGFNSSHARQLLRAGLTLDAVQESIQYFAFDLTQNDKQKQIKGPALNFFMGIMRRGPYLPPANYESEDDRRFRKAAEESEARRKRSRELEERLIGAQFEEWLETLSLEQKTRLVPPTEFARLGAPGHTARLNEYFRENVWPQLRQKILNGLV